MELKLMYQRCEVTSLHSCVRVETENTVDEQVLLAYLKTKLKGNGWKSKGVLDSCNSNRSTPLVP